MEYTLAIFLVSGDVTVGKPLGRRPFAIREIERTPGRAMKLHAGVGASLCVDSIEDGHLFEDRLDRNCISGLVIDR